MGFSRIRSASPSPSINSTPLTPACPPRRPVKPPVRHGREGKAHLGVALPVGRGARHHVFDSFSAQFAPVDGGTLALDEHASFAGNRHYVDAAVAAVGRSDGSRVAELAP